MKPSTFINLSLISLLLAGGYVYLEKPEWIQDYLPATKKVKKSVKRKAAKKVVKTEEVKPAEPEVTVQKQETPAEPEPKRPAEVADTPRPDKTAGKEAKVNPRLAVEDIGEVPMVLKNVGIIKGAEWADCAKVRDKVGAEILDKLGKPSASEINKFVRKGKNRLLLAQWIVADAELRSQASIDEYEIERDRQLAKAKRDFETMKGQTPASGATYTQSWKFNSSKEQFERIDNESKSAHRFSESAGDEGGQLLMEQIGGDPEWMEDFAFSGECKRPGQALSILKKIYKKHPDMLKNRMVRDIATATALEYARSNWNQEDAVDRATFYINAWKEGRLNPVFDKLPMWQRRMVCGCKGDNPYGSVASLTWALENFHLPMDRFTDCCWRCDYRLNNIYGDSIHGPHYYAPFEGSMGSNRHAMTYYVGGVCGSLSHFGAFAALAHGVPAMTAGEPGHCAFIVLVNDKWTPAYSLSWERGLHWQVFDQVYTYSALHSATELYSEKQKKETMASNAWRVVGCAYAAAGDVDKASICFEKAVTEQPRNWMPWREWRETLEKAQDAGSKHWKKMHDVLCKKLVPMFPEMAAEHMNKGLAAGLAKVLKPDELRKAYLDFWKEIKHMGPDRWRIEELASKQAELLGVSKNSEQLCAFYSDLLKTTAHNKLYAPAVLNWGNLIGETLDDAGNEARMQATIQALTKGKKMNAEDRVKVLDPVILATEESHDLNSFQSLGKMVKKSGYVNKSLKMPRIQPFPGKLVSADGMIWTSSTCNWDKPHEHPGVLTPDGGSFHTDKEENAYVVVELPRQANVTGIALVAPPNGMHGRLKNIKIQVSENGTDWKDVYQFGEYTERVMRSNLDNRKPIAKYVRVMRTGGPEFFHLSGIYVYGHLAA